VTLRNEFALQGAKINLPQYSCAGRPFEQWSMLMHRPPRQDGAYLNRPAISPLIRSR
jgi:hypothetical protein